MLEILKYKTPETLEAYEKILTEAWKKDWRYIGEKFDMMWFERQVKKTVSNKRPPIEDTILHEDNKQLWNRWSESLKESYKEFRLARYETHKDYVSPLAEKKLLNIVNKYSENISKKLMADSL